MEPKPGRLVKAVYEFPTDDESELPLQAGDIVQVQERIDKQWSRGICNNREGNFPIGFTIEVQIPLLADQQELFAVTHDFDAQQDGDLTLKKGDLVIGIRPVDLHWWEGQLDGHHGVFPLTHVWKINRNLLPVHKFNKKMFRKARVKMNLKAQLPEEIDLIKDEIVTVIEETEKGWYRGECNGKQGIFPASFVTLLNEDPLDNLQSLLSVPSTNSYSNDLLQNGNHSGYDCINSGITPYGRTIYPFQAEFPNELSFGAGEIVNLIRHVSRDWIKGELDGKTGIFPANFINIIVDCPDSKEKSGGTSETSDEGDNLFPADTYGRVICDFTPEVEGDVHLKEGDTVTLIRKVSQNWFEFITDNGETGLCPDCCIEVIGSGPPSYTEVMGSDYNKRFSLVSTGNIALGNINTSSQQENPASFSSTAFSSFSSHRTGSNDIFAKDVSSQSIDDKISDSLKGLDSSLFESTDNSLNNHGFKTFSSDSFTDSKKLTDFNNWLSDPLSENRSQNIHQTNIRDWSSDLFSSSATNNVNDIANKKNQRNVPSIVSIPARPPPPSIASQSPNTSLLTSSSVSANSTRLSVTSVSSQSSSDIDCFDQSDIKNTLQQKEKALEIRLACKKKLENENLRNSNNFISEEVKTQLAQLNEDIKQLKEEIETLQSELKVQESTGGNTAHECRQRDEEVARKKAEEEKRRAQAKIEKMEDQRSCIITEILQTENDYILDLKLLQSTFLKNSNEAKEKGINVFTLFGNLDEVIDVADRLLRRLIKQTESKNAEMIGGCFVDMADEMKEVYGHYCRNHDEVTSVIDKIDNDSAAGQYLKHKVEVMKKKTNCFDLPSMLIKPVQRILKYPLLLNELLKCTVDSHPDKQCLVQAISLMTDVATAINEFKRRKDLVFKYRKQNDTSLSGKISKFSMHSVVKKSSRFGMRLSSSIGLKTVVKDQEFEKVERRFNALQKSVRIFQKDMCDYTKKVEELVTTGFNIAEEIAELYQERKGQQEVDQFRSAHRIILTQFWEAFKQTIERNINGPIKQLLQAFRAPANLIQKRYDKLLDFESSTSKLEKNKDVTKIKVLQETQLMDKNNYEALNSQLLDDLPKLCDLSVEILYDCIRSFLKAKKNFIGRIAMHMFSLMDLPLLLGSQGTSILETFQVKHTLVMDDLCRLSILHKQMQSCIKADTLKRNSSPRGSRLSFGSPAPAVKSQSAGQKEQVKSAYPQSDLYSACQDFDAVDIMDISLKKGDIVGVIKQQDPMGTRLRWFVDNGDAKGFVPAKCLVKLLPSASSPLSQGASCDWNRQNIIAATRNTTTGQINHFASDKTKSQAIPSQNKENGPIQPTRPAPPVSSSLRVVPPSRYPPITQPISKRRESSSITPAATNNSVNIFVNKNSELDSVETVHRYEEIPDSLGAVIEHNKHSCDRDLMGSSEVTPTNILEEFDPYSSPKQPTELYDNVPDNLNCLYSTHRYEDIPDDVPYDYVPIDSQLKDANEYYFAMYDFSPTGPNQLSLHKGQIVLVLHKCDLNSNSEWWFVEDRHSNKGYVPGAYLNKYSKDVV